MIENGAGAVLLAEEALTSDSVVCFLRTLDQQESWSDLPLIVFPSGQDSSTGLIEKLGTSANVTTIERPVRIEILLNAVKAALRARRRQYQTRDLLLQLENADRQKDLFLATLSHELRTPLNAILGWSRLLSSGTLDPAKTSYALEVINRSATAQAQLIADILSVSQIVAGTLRIDKQPVDFAGVIRAAIDSIRPAAIAKDVEMQCALDPAAVVMGDAVRLQQIVSNILSNAVKFTPSKGRVTVELRRGDGLCELLISDTGKGIAADFLPYVFDRFRQADNSYTRAHGGLGLGLAIVRHLVELHGGRVRAESAGEGTGTTFVVTLTTSDDDDKQPTGPASSCEAPPVLKGLCVLAVDDDAESLTLLENVLHEYGATVIAVGSADAALDSIKAHRPDVLVSDIGMPGGDGYDLLRRATAMHSGRPIPAIALTGYASQKDRDCAFAVGYRAHIAKPFEPADLIHAIEDVAFGGTRFAQKVKDGRS
jgi:signal transduction histidine kinase/CheY-like chemotaxis protein